MKIILNLTRIEREFLVNELNDIFQMFCGNLDCLLLSIHDMNDKTKRFNRRFIGEVVEYISLVFTNKFSLSEEVNIGYRGINISSVIHKLNEERIVFSYEEMQVLLQILDMYIRLCLGDFTQFKLLLDIRFDENSILRGDIDDFLDTMFSPLFPGTELHQHKLAVHELPENVKWLQDIHVTIQKAIAEYKLQHSSDNFYSVYIGHTLRYSGNSDINVEILKGE